jgi:hypothetical protein
MNGSVSEVTRYEMDSQVSVPTRIINYVALNESWPTMGLYFGILLKALRKTTKSVS